MKKITVIIPVSRNEPLSIIKKSFESISSLDKKDACIDVVYSIDIDSENDTRVLFLRKKGISVVERNNSRGKRAGAINDALKAFGQKYDYIAIFDVDSRPDPDFISVCIDKLNTRDDAVIASGMRYITNEEETFVTKIISAEYCLISDLYSLINYFNGFLQFNGLIGVLKADVFKEKYLDEEKVCEDVEVTQRIYMHKKRAVYSKYTRVGEQSCTTLSDLYNQRVRWFTGALECLDSHFPKFLYAKIPFSEKMSWLIAMTLSFAILLFLPFIPFYSIRLRKKSNSVNDLSIKILGMMFHSVFLQVCSIAAIIKYLTGYKVDWTSIKRSDV